MARRCGVWVVAGALALGSVSASWADEAALRESVAEGTTTRVLVTLKADGLFRAGPPPGVRDKEKEKAKTAEPVKPQ